MAQLKLELLKEEAKELSEHRAIHKVSAGTFFRKAIEIEDRRSVPHFPLLYLY